MKNYDELLSFVAQIAGYWTHAEQMRDLLAGYPEEDINAAIKDGPCLEVLQNDNEDFEALILQARRLLASLSN